MCTGIIVNYSTIHCILICCNCDNTTRSPSEVTAISHGVLVLLETRIDVHVHVLMHDDCDRHGKTIASSVQSWNPRFSHDCSLVS
jgi:hypothetical protein